MHPGAGGLPNEMEKDPRRTLACPEKAVYIPPYLGDVAQLGERRVRNAEARGSIPLISTRI